MKSGPLEPRSVVATVVYQGNLVVVCADGSVWFVETLTDTRWQEFKPIPGTKADHEDKN